MQFEAALLPAGDLHIMHAQPPQLRLPGPVAAGTEGQTLMRRVSKLLSSHRRTADDVLLGPAVDRAGAAREAGRTVGWLASHDPAGSKRGNGDRAAAASAGDSVPGTPPAALQHQSDLLQLQVMHQLSQLASGQSKQGVAQSLQAIRIMCSSSMQLAIGSSGAAGPHTAASQYINNLLQGQQPLKTFSQQKAALQAISLLCSTALPQTASSSN